ncbi:hypothetical protein NEF87_002122 [Candidatus Lokiarchaeum ossiferum]|uniref:Uncharacterized protein n=1 Tax=Candidatus Lokiarchaeum ossiferum TaxID=2951803 RepID=A0ABY6HSK3_9ARCH|nr:hypothetical protein NEF87_002122 [Candidatus Lokiarchaeum sp. B-35]
MNILQKIQEQFLVIKDRFSNVHLKLEDIVDANNQMLKSHLKLCKESNEGIIALKIFGEHESPGLKQAFINLSDALKSIEVSRTAMVTMLETSFVDPIKELAHLQREVYKAETLTGTAQTALEKSQEKLKAKKEKPRDGLEEAKLEKLDLSIKNAEDGVKESEELLSTRKKNESMLKIKLAKNKLENMKRTLTLLVQEYKKLHSIGINSLTDTKDFVDKINIQKESTSAILYPIPRLNTEDYVEGMKILRNTVKNVGSRLEKVRKENVQLLDAHLLLQVETRKAITLFKEFAKEETPGIQNAIENFAEGLETIESNREAFVKQMRFEFIQPIDNTIKEKETLLEQLEKTLENYKDHKKWEGILQKIRGKEANNLKPGELEEAKENVARLDKITNHEHNILTQNTHLFTVSKIEACKNSLTSILERNLKFHDQAFNIIANTEILAKDIEIKKEFNSVDLRSKPVEKTVKPEKKVPAPVKKTPAPKKTEEKPVKKTESAPKPAAAKPTKKSSKKSSKKTIKKSTPKKSTPKKS